MARRRKRRAPEEVPTDMNGNVQRVGRTSGSWINGTDTFIAALALHRHYKYGSAYRLILVDTESGRTYPVFAGDFFKMMEKVSMVNGEIIGEWGYCKKSSYYGVYLIQEIERE
jgi:hypothetical protein